MELVWRFVPRRSGLQLGESDLSAQRKADLHSETQMPESLHPEFLNSEVCKLWLWYCSALRVCTQFQKYIYYWNIFFCKPFTISACLLKIPGIYKVPSVSLSHFSPTITGKYRCLFLFMRLLRNNVAVLIVQLWLSLMIGPGASVKEKKTSQILQTTWKSTSSLETHPRANSARQPVPHRHTFGMMPSLESIIDIQVAWWGIFTSVGKFSSELPLQVIFKAC